MSKKIEELENNLKTLKETSDKLNESNINLKADLARKEEEIKTKGEELTKKEKKINEDETNMKKKEKE